MLQSRKFYLALFGAVAWSSTAADSILSLLEAASFSSTQSSLVNIAAVAGTFDVVSFCCIGLYTVHHVGSIRGALERSGQARNILVSIIVFVSGAALLVTLVLIIMIKSRWAEVTAGPTAAPVYNWDSHVSGQIASWVISCVSQLALYSSPFWNDKAPNVQTVVTSGPRDSVMSEFRSSRPDKLNLEEPTRPLTPPSGAYQRPESMTALPSPTFSTRSSQSLRSFRESLRHVVRPVTSRTTLISQKSFTREAPNSIYSNRQSLETISQSDGFDSWDTSSVSLPARESVLQQTAPYRTTTLEPIPGSRPNSPARALDGPFLSELPEEEDEDLAPPPKMMPDISRPPSPAVSEAHIHPLFRSESPSGLPPPAATPGTSILASPLSTEAIACPSRMFNRMRSNSGRSQATGAPSIRQARSFIRDPGASIRSMSRSPSPPSRAITPPIPDFVLNSSPRSSTSGSRKVSLRHSPNH
ncbi:hypothetical protein PtrSN002B_004112 [Pyrenophora tritici-repentis]|uniref:Tymo-45kd-70kd domain containing protein n=2 Tax=Pyrenophora tritici-repentis TaxID=45151 RepID=A0A2W1HAA3_9PLEO|nr:uncharacterized protein PTRG_03534 [Pyrenophora tritici-repentis Pt-1C-BFP]KAA8620420.1 hypothetical protein PtrV1_07514 [Pyrenophora tritici-repentis]EDU46372.1 conserved hypothetical protein [Pyrenophora tritici-repentis Pt-1C-BFP]KAF7448578.1 hypothetical protein A1F99_079420 [Pyrenophora tritici-repentis]KAF7572298.1 Tymo-45kd-70kd domain containing protein [Pyrenophora tritici-repentis]KAG9384523.1 hypothetical protein A1F94_004070 [Pyrenophora tritici-repentis]